MSLIEISENISTSGKHSTVEQWQLLECNRLEAYMYLVQIDNTIHCINMILKTNQCALD